MKASCDGYYDGCGRRGQRDGVLVCKPSFRQGSTQVTLPVGTYPYKSAGIYHRCQHYIGDGTPTKAQKSSQNDAVVITKGGKAMKHTKATAKAIQVVADTLSNSKPIEAGSVLSPKATEAIVHAALAQLKGMSDGRSKGIWLHTKYSGFNAYLRARGVDPIASVDKACEAGLLHKRPAKDGVAVALGKAPEAIDWNAIQTE